MPFTSFSEFNKAAGSDVWFAFYDSAPSPSSPGYGTPWTSVRKIEEGETTNELFGYLTTDAIRKFARSIRRRCR